MSGRQSPAGRANLPLQICRPYGACRDACKPAAANMPLLRGLVGPPLNPL
ncbi:Uncharacterized protein dnm_060730 [Desulfonema magnum]|uniref:Uncharacterized protein n=1 Tax=Desulfonema magnum TaxID=45655 RepID=A0A975GRH5_9BACT|nr:Uncharacterized protein dnm_060730 [Desulfonema magnum]